MTIFSISATFIHIIDVSWDRTYISPTVKSRGAVEGRPKGQDSREIMNTMIFERREFVQL